MSQCSLILSLGSSYEYSSSCQRLLSDCAGGFEPLWSHISHCWKSHVTAGSAVAQWKSAWLETEGPRVRASPESLRCVLEQDTSIQSDLLGEIYTASHLLVTMEQTYLLKLSAAYKHTGRSCGPRSDCHLHQVVLKISFYRPNVMSSKIFYRFCQIFADYWFWGHFLLISELVLNFTDCWFLDLNCTDSRSVGLNFTA